MWSRLDDGLLDHPKTHMAGELLGPDGRLLVIGMYAIGLMWTNKQLTDGVLPVASVKTFQQCRKPLRIADALVAAKLWHFEQGVYRIHDFHQYNDPAADVRAEREMSRWRRALYADPSLVAAVRLRDVGRCRYCGQLVDWTNRRGARGGLFARADPTGPTALNNVVTVCRRCVREPNGAPVLAPGSMG
jgi:hypothetical protein